VDNNKLRVSSKSIKAKIEASIDREKSNKKSSDNNNNYKGTLIAQKQEF
jgi:hypothetical protein